ncbi:30S ribosomal protein S16 [Candidatus Hodgkinia cicadicola]|nr:30S ribosomal protein S16 [Candidatus Hodgkinia cicadicola]
MVKIKLVPRREVSHIVIADSRRATNAKAIDRIGLAGLKRGVPCVSIDITALKFWLRAGALPTKAAAKLLASVGLL